MDDDNNHPIYERLFVDGPQRLIRFNLIIYYAQFGLTFIIFLMMIAMTSYISITLKDSRQLLTDGTDTLIDFGELLPKVNESLYILETLCNSKHSPIHEWCQA
jgi:hypothetical protein